MPQNVPSVSCAATKSRVTQCDRTFSAPSRSSGKAVSPFSGRRPLLNTGQKWNTPSRSMYPASLSVQSAYSACCSSDSGPCGSKKLPVPGRRNIDDVSSVEVHDEEGMVMINMGSSADAQPTSSAAANPAHSSANRLGLRIGSASFQSKCVWSTIIVPHFRERSRKVTKM